VKIASPEALRRRKNGHSTSEGKECTEIQRHMLALKHRPCERSVS
jgi:hypothetical protein